ncbi:uncharacterized protein LOC129921126 [Episyrphus balteatus]|uniref:uncharacterized protein LOC129921126 n=1 Tax=Episyrphus balteatus TaxID=286459 RepID=UPI002486719B|nr:uncharacterized protein LOC129921126 [Episyrphus balteatus]
MICCFTMKSFLNMSLPTAGMVIGYISTVINLFQTGICFKIDEIREYSHKFGQSVPEIVDIATPILLLICLLDLMASVMLIIGVNKRNHLLLLPWMINNSLFLSIKIFLGIGLITQVFSEARSGHIFDTICSIIFILSIIVFFCLVWNAIYSLFQSIRKENEGFTLDTERLVENSNPCSYELFRNSD